MFRPLLYAGLAPPLCILIVGSVVLCCSRGRNDTIDCVIYICGVDLRAAAYDARDCIILSPQDAKIAVVSLDPFRPISPRARSILSEV